LRSDAGGTIDPAPCSPWIVRSRERRSRHQIHHPSDTRAHRCGARLQHPCWCGSDAPPGQGNQTHILYGVHPNAKTNETIIAFIAEHGEIWWHESTYNHTHEYVYIVPANACEEQLVYLNRIRADEHGGEQSIEQIWIIGCDEAMPLAAELRFPEIFAKYPALSNDGGLRSYVENQSPNRYEEVTTRPSRTQVYFINDTGMFTEYIVDLSGGEIVSTTYVSEENLTVGRAEAEAQALSGQSADARVESTILKVYSGDRIVWEITVRAGRETDIVQVP